MTGLPAPGERRGRSDRLRRRLDRIRRGEPRWGTGEPRRLPEATEDRPARACGRGHLPPRARRPQPERVGETLVWRETIDPLRAQAADADGEPHRLGFHRLRHERDAAAGLLYLDLETTGLASTDRIFLVGMAHWEGEELHLTQVLARDVVGELGLVEEVARRLAHRLHLVTYNGRSFDVPFLRRRLAFHGLPPLPREVTVDDLLHRCRRAHRDLDPDHCLADHRLADHRLATVERELLGIRRDGRDVPGAEVPLRFLDYVETGELQHLDPVLYHNRIDLTSMALLLTLLGEADADSGESSDSSSDCPSK